MSESIYEFLWYVNNIMLALLQGGFLWYNLTPKFNKHLVFLITTVPFTFLVLSQKFVTFVAPSFLVLLPLAYYFICAAVLIIYYKQIIEGYDDRARFGILQKVGMDKKLIAASVRSQILTMFLLPLGVAALHLAVAFPLLTRVLKAMMLKNTPLFLTCTLATFGAFAAVYLVVYAFTSRVYYRIVSSRESR